MLYDEPLKLNTLRDDLVFYPVPFDKIVAEVCKDAKLRRLVKNMIYDGVLSKLLNIDLAQMEHALKRQMGKKLKAIELNMAALEAGSAYAAQHLTKRDPYWVEPMDKTAGMILVEGNAAGGARLHDGRRHRRRLVSDHAVVVAARNADQLPEEVPPRQADGKATYAVVQAEDEIASIGMVIGAGLGGRARDDVDVGPGHLADGGVRRAGVLRGSAGRGLRHPARRAVDRPADAHRAGGHPRARALLSHGDTKQIMLIPASVEECYTMAMDAFDLAERFQSLVFVMSDLDLAMNTWMSRDRSSIRSGRSIAARSSTRRRWRGSASGAATRTSTATAFRIARFPATDMPAYFTRGSGHNENGQYSERPDDYVNNMDRLARKFETARQHVPKPEVVDDARRRDRHHRLRHQPLGDRREPRRSWSGSSACTTGYLRLRAYPFTDELDAFIDRYDARLRRRAEPRRADARR